MHAPSINIKSIALFTVLSLFVAFPTALLAADAGAIEKLSGTATIVGADNVSRAAGAKAKIQAGDTIATDAKSETLIRLSDDTAIILRPNSRFQVVDYKYDKAPTDSSFVSLLRGTARFVTGLIGKNRPSNIHFTAATITIGIRGTDFEVAIVPEDTADARAGVYDYVHDGSTNIMLAQTGQNLDVKKDQTAFAPDKLRPGEDALQILRETPIFLQSGGGLDALIQSITAPIPMFFR